MWMMTRSLLCLVISIQVCHGAEFFPRPIWNIAHMVNALYQVDYYLNMGANSIEFDIAFDWDGNARYTFHGIPCDCFRSCMRHEEFNVYLDYMRQLTSPGDPRFREQLVLLFFDLKLSGLSSSSRYRAGVDIAKKIVNIYWRRGESNARAYLMISIPSVTYKEFVKGFRETLKSEGFSHYESKIGYDFSGNEDLYETSKTWESLNISCCIWQGDGITNCLPRGTGRLRRAIGWRDQSSVTYIDKVYWWTVDKMSTMRQTLRLGVDALITNYPERLVNVLKEEEFSSKMKMATIEDNPWSKFPVFSAPLYMRDDDRTGNETKEEENEDELLYNC